MGKLNGILPIEGTVGKITFAKTKDGIIVREKGGISAARIANDPAFRRTRENNSEFGRAGKAGRMIISALRTTIRAKADSRVSSRLMKVLMAAQQEDAINKRGLRNITSGNPYLLEGFDLNANAPLATTFYAPYTVTIDRAAGSYEVAFPEPINRDSVAAPAGATSYQLSAACVLANFDVLTSEVSGISSATLPLDASSNVPALKGSFTANTTLTLLVTLNLSFYQEVNGDYYLLSNGAYNPAAIVRVDV